MTDDASQTEAQTFRTVDSKHQQQHYLPQPYLVHDVVGRGIQVRCNVPK